MKYTISILFLMASVGCSSSKIKVQDCKPLYTDMQGNLVSECERAD